MAFSVAWYGISIAFKHYYEADETTDDFTFIA